MKKHIVVRTLLALSAMTALASVFGAGIKWS
jgi:hypothetical protein